ncbi:putative reverse transcriptase (RNA-dependent DNA polymerase) [Trypanosoma cruzi]|uniref:Putative reverse transcriptase (RNA-dependent DNA polymerase) n=1 Tax=Trypanosoma cruzi TaxID=5693 RepID=A0A2V2X473_TRYCR|nr:putative reverse transcriptase (RNA-dependent DNA polymerase) [Trypanosoma cruzi]
MRVRYVGVCTREQHSRKQLTSAVAPQGSVPGPKLFFRHVDDLLHRMDNIYSAAAFIYADALTLVASGADIHACAAAMQPAPSLTTAWASEHNLKINVAKSEAALFYISSHTHGLTRKWSISILAAGTYVFSHARCACWTQRLIVFFWHARFYRCKADHATPLSAAAGRTGWCVPSHHAILFDCIRS